MANYYDYIVVPVPTRKLPEYKKMAKRWTKIWKELGALDYVESIAVEAKPGKLTSFPQSLLLKKTETVVMGCITFKSKKHRDQLWKKMMEHPEMTNMDMSKVPFDGARMFWGGFQQFT